MMALHTPQTRFNIIAIAQYKWIFFVLGGSLLLIPKTWPKIIYMTLGIIYISYDVLIFGLLVFFGTLMNDSNVPMAEVVKSLCIYIGMTLPFIFYWLVSMIYIFKTKDIVRGAKEE